MNYNFNLADILISLALTAIAYIGPPVAYAFIIRKRHLTQSEARKTCIITGIGIYLVFFFLYAYLDVDGGGNIYPAVIWSSVAYWIISKTIKESSSSDKDDTIVQKQSRENKSDEMIGPLSDTGIQVDALHSLKELHEDGVLTDEEFAEKKKQILGI